MLGKLSGFIPYYSEYSIKELEKTTKNIEVKIDADALDEKRNESKFNQYVMTNKTFYQKTRDAYNAAIGNFVKFLEKHGFLITGMVIGTLLQEPWQAIRAGILNLTNLKKDFNFYNLNPKILTREQLQNSPILLLHGDLHNQSAWLGLAKKLQQVKGIGALYTINLPSGKFTKTDFQLVQNKIDEISNQYFSKTGLRPKICLIGHSRGGSLALLMSRFLVINSEWGEYKAEPKVIEKIITLGEVASQIEIDELKLRAPNLHDHIYEVTGKYDILLNEQSVRDTHHKKEVKTGHLGLLNSSEAHEYIIQCLVNN